MRFTNVKFSGLRGGAVCFPSELWKKTSKDDKARVLKVVSDTRYGDPHLRGRSLVITLYHPIAHNDTNITSLRLKGIAPKIPIEMHRGAGYVPVFTAVDNNGNAILLINGAGAGGPEGSMAESTAFREFDVALECGPQICDIPFGYGSYSKNPGYISEEERLGFVIFGQESPYDMRVSGYLHYLEQKIATNTLKRWQRKAKETFRLMGKNLARFHRGDSDEDKGFVHKYCGPNNTGIIINPYNVPVKTIIRDLETALPLRTLFPEKQYGYLLNDFIRCFGGLVWDSLFPGLSAVQSAMLENFLRGYFGPAFPFSGKKVAGEFKSIKDSIQMLEYGLFTGARINLPEFLSRRRPDILQFIHLNLAAFSGLGTIGRLS